MRDWLAHRLLTVLHDRQRGTIPKRGCKEVREHVKRGNVSAAVEYLQETAGPAEDPVADWPGTPLRDAVAEWEADGRLSPSRAERIRNRLSREDWVAAVTLVRTAEGYRR